MKMLENEIITTKNVHLYYGQKEALKGINLNFKEKGIHALIGPSGCGKSTYLRTLNRMNDMIDNVKITGDIQLNGQDVYDEKMDLVELRTRVGMVFQQPNPFPFSIYDNVTYGLKMAGVKDKNILDEAVETSLKKAAIWDEVKDDLKKNALALSGGQQQRICIARLLANSPEVILLDEPTSALDPISTDKVEEMLLTLKDDYTCIMVTHNMQQASRISDTTSFFLDGNLIESDTTKTMFLNPKEKQTIDYLSGKFG
ncbi:ABC superfamily ATP binding cassette transporter ABC protein [Ligilactobacillus hayakitensis DSM 18933 = JCM 14209]|uniref:ABC superfamily ATP binding cassette transporter ABC protein n=2 Tax=Ligilactobacillus TaxID=2767887 RepID=A0A0R1WP81_9LACO|nr:ABC superfamily ATP binding cassette transporter ABC protein [Ligilactobacillus hayakitensis DSM 18933 = JCM 14209]